MIGQILFTAGDHEAGMTGMLTALAELPAEAPERSQLIEHTAYLSERIHRNDFLQLVERHVPPGPLAVAILTALANRPMST